MDDATFVTWLTDELATLPGVLAVTLGGSRAQGTHTATSDWDFAVYYRDAFDPRFLRAKGWEGQVFEIGGWGGGVMNGGAWLTIDGRRVDVHYRDIREVEHWCVEAEAGRFDKQLLLFYAAGIPTYVLMAELATHRVLHGALPRPDYPELLARSADRRWHADAGANLGYAATALDDRQDIGVALAATSRALIEASHSLLARRRQWVLNEKRIVARAGLGDHAALLLAAKDTIGLGQAILAIRAYVEHVAP